MRFWQIAGIIVSESSFFVHDATINSLKRFHKIYDVAKRTFIPSGAVGEEDSITALDAGSQWLEQFFEAQSIGKIFCRAHATL